MQYIFPKIEERDYISGLLQFIDKPAREIFVGHELASE